MYFSSCTATNKLILACEKAIENINVSNIRGTESMTQLANVALSKVRLVASNLILLHSDSSIVSDLTEIITKWTLKTIKNIQISISNKSSQFDDRVDDSILYLDFPIIKRCLAIIIWMDCVTVFLTKTLNNSSHLLNNSTIPSFSANMKLKAGFGLNSKISSDFNSHKKTESYSVLKDDLASDLENILAHTLNDFNYRKLEKLISTSYLDAIFLMIKICFKEIALLYSAKFKTLIKALITYIKPLVSQFSIISPLNHLVDIVSPIHSCSEIQLLCVSDLRFDFNNGLDILTILTSILEQSKAPNVKFLTIRVVKKLIDDNLISNKVQKDSGLIDGWSTELDRLLKIITDLKAKSKYRQYALQLNISVLCLCEPSIFRNQWISLVKSCFNYYLDCEKNVPKYGYEVIESDTLPKLCTEFLGEISSLLNGVCDLMNHYITSVHGEAFATRSENICMILGLLVPAHSIHKRIKIVPLFYTEKGFKDLEEFYLNTVLILTPSQPLIVLRDIILPLLTAVTSSKLDKRDLSIVLTISINSFIFYRIVATRGLVYPFFKAIIPEDVSFLCEQAENIGQDYLLTKDVCDRIKLAIGRCFSESIRKNLNNSDMYFLLRNFMVTRPILGSPCQSLTCIMDLMMHSDPKVSQEATKLFIKYIEEIEIAIEDQNELLDDIVGRVYRDIQRYSPILAVSISRLSSSKFENAIYSNKFVRLIEHATGIAYLGLLQVDEEVRENCQLALQSISNFIVDVQANREQILSSNKPETVLTSCDEMKAITIVSHVNKEKDHFDQIGIIVSRLNSIYDVSSSAFSFIKRTAMECPLLICYVGRIVFEWYKCNESFQAFIEQKNILNFPSTNNHFQSSPSIEVHDTPNVRRDVPCLSANLISKLIFESVQSWATHSALLISWAEILASKDAKSDSFGFQIKDLFKCVEDEKESSFFKYIWSEKRERADSHFEDIDDLKILTKILNYGIWMNQNLDDQSIYAAFLACLRAVVTPVLVPALLEAIKPRLQEASSYLRKNSFSVVKSSKTSIIGLLHRLSSVLVILCPSCPQIICPSLRDESFGIIRQFILEVFYHLSEATIIDSKTLDITVEIRKNLGDLIFSFVSALNGLTNRKVLLPRRLHLKFFMYGIAWVKFCDLIKNDSDKNRREESDPSASTTVVELTRSTSKDFDQPTLLGTERNILNSKESYKRLYKSQSMNFDGRKIEDVKKNINNSHFIRTSSAHSLDASAATVEVNSEFNSKNYLSLEGTDDLEHRNIKKTEYQSRISKLISGFCHRGALLKAIGESKDTHNTFLAALCLELSVSCKSEVDSVDLEMIIRWINSLEADEKSFDVGSIAVFNLMMTYENAPLIVERIIEEAYANHDNYHLQTIYLGGIAKAFAKKFKIDKIIKIALLSYAISLACFFEPAGRQDDGRLVRACKLIILSMGHSEDDVFLPKMLFKLGKNYTDIAEPIVEELFRKVRWDQKQLKGLETVICSWSNLIFWPIQKRNFDHHAGNNNEEGAQKNFNNKYAEKESNGMLMACFLNSYKSPKTNILELLFNLNDRFPQNQSCSKYWESLLKHWKHHIAIVIAFWMQKILDTRLSRVLIESTHLFKTISSNETFKDVLCRTISNYIQPDAIGLSDFNYNELLMNEKISTDSCCCHIAIYWLRSFGSEFSSEDFNHFENLLSSHDSYTISLNANKISEYNDTVKTKTKENSIHYQVKKVTDLTILSWALSSKVFRYVEKSWSQLMRTKTLEIEFFGPSIVARYLAHLISNLNQSEFMINTSSEKNQFLKDTLISKPDIQSMDLTTVETLFVCAINALQRYHGLFESHKKVGKSIELVKFVLLFARTDGPVYQAAISLVTQLIGLEDLAPVKTEPHVIKKHMRDKAFSTYMSNQNIKLPTFSFICDEWLYIAFSRSPSTSIYILSRAICQQKFLSEKKSNRANFVVLALVGMLSNLLSIIFNSTKTFATRRTLLQWNSGLDLEKSNEIQRKKFSNHLTSSVPVKVTNFSDEFSLQQENFQLCFEIVDFIQRWAEEIGGLERTSQILRSLMAMKTINNKHIKLPTCGLDRSKWLSLLAELYGEDVFDDYQAMIVAILRCKLDFKLQDSVEIDKLITFLDLWIRVVKIRFDCISLRDTLIDTWQYWYGKNSFITNKISSIIDKLLTVNSESISYSSKHANDSCSSSNRDASFTAGGGGVCDKTSHPDQPSFHRCSKISSCLEGFEAKVQDSIVDEYYLSVPIERDESTLTGVDRLDKSLKVSNNFNKNEANDSGVMVETFKLSYGSISKVKCRYNNWTEMDKGLQSLF